LGEGDARSLAAASGVPLDDVHRLVGQIHSNAARISHQGRAAGCALSAHVGFANHDCAPNCAARVDAAGMVALTALGDLVAGDELTISYVDARLPYAVWIASTGLGGPHQTSELSISVNSKSIWLIFGRIDCSRRVLEAQRKSPVQTVRLRAH
jgi:hypothetical protein